MPRPDLARFRRLLPSALTTHTPNSKPVRPFDDTNAIASPAGDHTGAPTDTSSSSNVICRESPVRVEVTQRLAWPPLSERKAI
jgi:hypothetical protein